MRASTQNLLRAGYIFCALFVSFSALADRSDWLAVERFESQLKQAEEGKVSAMHETAHMYERGRGTDTDYAAAALWYKKANDSGYAPATARLGLLYFEGRGVKQDHKKAFKLLSSAANDNIPLAQYQLGTMYQYGTVVAQNKSKAMFWFTKARKGGDYRAEKKLQELNTQANIGPTVVVTKPKIIHNNSKKSVKNTSQLKLHPTMLAVIKGQWNNNNRPAGYLPSSINRCSNVDNGTLICKTQLQKRQTDIEIITYNTQATLSRFHNKRFTIQYTNTIVDVELRKIDPSTLDEDEEVQTQGSSGIKVGSTSRPRTMLCELIKNNHVRCIRDKIHTYNFHG
jgi:hypothetical protein